jgi:hypothetical protein
MGKRVAHDDRALAGVFAFGIAGLIFVSSVGALLLLSRGTSTPAVTDPQNSAALNGKARGLADLLLSSPGFSSGGLDWEPGNNWGAGASSADNLVRLGLMEDSQPNFLSFAKLQNLRRAPFAANPTDGYVNYPEAQGDLGLASSSLNFHIRAYPTLKSVAQILKTGWRDPNLRLTYLGDVDVRHTYGNSPPPASPTEGMTVGTPTCAISPLNPAGSPQDYRLSVQVTNGGSTTTQFSAVFTYNLAATGAQSQDANGGVLAPGATTTLFVDVPAAKVKVGGLDMLRSCAIGSTISAIVHDPATASVTASTILTTAVAGATEAPKDLWVDASKAYYVNANGATSGCTDPVTISYDGLTLAKNDKLAVKVTDSGGTQVHPASGSYALGQGGTATPDSSNFYRFATPNPDQKKTVAIGCLPAGFYTATLWYYSGNNPATTDEHVVEQLVVTTAALAGFSPASAPPPQGPDIYVAQPWASAEAAMLDTLVEQFCPTYFDSQSNRPVTYPVDWNQRCSDFKAAQSQPGDVFPDSKDVMNNELPKRLVMDPRDCDSEPRYDITNVLVAGSNVDQTAMTSAAAKQCVATWVAGGGTLIAFGSEDQNVNWLEPIFHSAIRSSSGGIGVPDPGHPVLHVSDELDYPQYDNLERVWQFNGQTAQNAATLFTNIVVQGSDPVTTESNPGAMGDGTVILTSWLPYDVYNGTRDPTTTYNEGLRLVNNLLMQGYRGLFLDYGPALPSNSNVIPAVRVVQVQHPQFADPIQLSVILFVFGS